MKADRANHTRLVNCTPHELRVFTDQSQDAYRLLPPGTRVPRVEVREKEVGTIEGVPVFASAYGAPVGLPEPAPGTVFVVSLAVRLACPERADLVSPGELVRDAQGQPVGCLGLRTTQRKEAPSQKGDRR